jgi:hypothetical protein
LIKFNEAFELFLALFEMSSTEKESCRLMLNVNDKSSHFANTFNNPNDHSNYIQPFNLIDFTLLDNFFIKLYEY